MSKCHTEEEEEAIKIRKKVKLLRELSAWNDGFDPDVYKHLSLKDLKIIRDKLIEKITFPCPASMWARSRKRSMQLKSVKLYMDEVERIYQAIFPKRRDNGIIMVVGEYIEPLYHTHFPIILAPTISDIPIKIYIMPCGCNLVVMSVVSEDSIDNRFAFFGDTVKPCDRLDEFEENFHGYIFDEYDEKNNNKKFTFVVHLSDVYVFFRLFLKYLFMEKYVSASSIETEQPNVISQALNRIFNKPDNNTQNTDNERENSDEK